ETRPVAHLRSRDGDGALRLAPTRPHPRSHATRAATERHAARTRATRLGAAARRAVRPRHRHTALGQRIAVPTDRAEAGRPGQPDARTRGAPPVYEQRAALW